MPLTSRILSSNPCVLRAGWVCHYCYCCYHCWVLLLLLLLMVLCSCCYFYHCFWQLKSFGLYRTGQHHAVEDRGPCNTTHSEIDGEVIIWQFDLLFLWQMPAGPLFHHTFTLSSICTNNVKICVTWLCMQHWINYLRYGTAQAQRRTRSHEHNDARKSNSLKSGHGTHFNHESSHLQP